MDILKTSILCVLACLFLSASWCMYHSCIDKRDNEPYFFIDRNNDSSDDEETTWVFSIDDDDIEIRSLSQELNEHCGE